MKPRRTPKSLCGKCGKDLDGAAAADGKDAAPKAGDLTLCLYCGQLHEFSATLGLTMLDDVPEDADDETRDLIRRTRMALGKLRAS